MYTKLMLIAVISITFLYAIILASRALKRRSRLLQHYFIPSALVAGAIGLLLGDQLIGVVPAEMTSVWSHLPEYLISIVFAGLFLGKVIPSGKQIWNIAGPQIAFGNTLAWGQYVVGIGLTLLVLTPVFGANPLAGALIEVSFEGGHGTAAGLAPTFEKLGWADGTDLALGLATFSILVAITAGILLVNWYSRKTHTKLTPKQWKAQHQQMINSGYNLMRVLHTIRFQPAQMAINVIALGTAIGIGWLMLQGCIWLEDVTLQSFTDLRFFPYMPLFPMAMLGGLIVQITLQRMGRDTLIHRKTVDTYGAIALDFLVASAIATISLAVIAHNLPVFIILGVAGVVWILGAFIFLAPRMFPVHWFEKGLTNMGQSMGMTATGLLLNRLVDPTNRTNAYESFAFKQLVFEPFMGGGIVTAAAVILIFELGSVPVLVGSAVVTVFWLVLGLYLAKTHKVDPDIHEHL